MSFDDDNDFLEDGSSEDEQNDQDDGPDDQEDNDGDDGDQDEDDDEDADGDGDGDEDDDGDNGDADDTEMQDVTQNSQPSNDKKSGQLTMPSGDSNDPLKLTPSQRAGEEGKEETEQKEDKDDPTTVVDYLTVRPEALTAVTYDIVPTIAAPHSTSINCITATPNMKFVFSGGSDGYIRKFNWPDTANGKLMLTVAQRHPFVDSVTKAGVLLSYWENEEGLGKPENLSPVYSLAVNKNALWLLSGLESGGINLQSVRHDEGKLIHRLKEHTSAVSVLQLAPDERSVLSGSWDKRIFDWDLDTGQVIRRYEETGGQQISAVEVRPESSLPVPKAEEPPRLPNGTFASNNAQKPTLQSISNGVPQGESGDAVQGQPSPAASHHSFSSLFGDDNDENGMDTSFGNTGGDGDNDLFGGAVTTDMRPGEEPSVPAADGADTTMTDMLDTPAKAEQPTNSTNENDTKPAGEQPGPSSPGRVANGSIPHVTDANASNPHSYEPATVSNSATSIDGPSTHSNSTFLSASIDGSIRIWDRRVSSAVVKLPSRFAPPWCMSAVWSPDGNSFYAGRRNGSVEEYSLHKPLAAPSRTFRFPSGSGAVSALKAMPNGRHLVCASFDILRLYDLHHEDKAGASTAVGKTPFLIVPGHRTGVVSSLFLDHKCRFMISSAGNRGWEGISTQVLLGYEIGI